VTDRVGHLLVVAVLLAGMAGCKREPAQPAQPTTAPVAASTAGASGAKPIPVVHAKVPPAPKPTGPLPATASCVTQECHADYTRATQIHAPIASRDCSSCHGDDTGGHKYPLRRAGNQTCTFCHAVIGTREYTHKAIDQGCLSCHQAHTSNTKYLLKKPSVESNCAQCHNTPLRKFAHKPFFDGQCSQCHEPHQADNKLLLRAGTGPQQCYTCHNEEKTAVAQAKHVHQPVREGCEKCHQAHTSDYPHQLQSSVSDNCLSCHPRIKEIVDKAPVKHSAMVMANSCNNCHDAHASTEPALLKQRMVTVCLGCHDKQIVREDGRRIANMKPVLTQSKFLHGPVRDGSCSGCHDPHGAAHVDLLDRAFPSSFYTAFDVAKYDLCFSCHAPQIVLEKNTVRLTNFRDGDENLHFVHVNRDVKGRSCRTCHSVHGSNLPNHMASEVPFEDSNWAMAIEYNKTVDGGRCAPGCHTPREYNRGKRPTTVPTTGDSP
jgi:predicted CXXCH cytochrome family protein